jgi:anthranilate 1,2-dioxygenase small subunit
MSAPPLDALGVSQRLADYGAWLDAMDYEAWLGLFTADCDYQITTRENEQAGLPLALMWCDGQAMLADRLASLQHVNEYNLHYPRHVIGMARRLAKHTEAPHAFEAPYALYQTTLEGESRLFSVGRYAMQWRAVNGDWRLHTMRVIVDTAQVPSLLACPI